MSPASCRCRVTTGDNKPTAVPLVAAVDTRDAVAHTHRVTHAVAVAAPVASSRPCRPRRCRHFPRLPPNLNPESVARAVAAVCRPPARPLAPPVTLPCHSVYPRRRFVIPLTPALSAAAHFRLLPPPGASSRVLVACAVALVARPFLVASLSLALLHPLWGFPPCAGRPVTTPTTTSIAHAPSSPLAAHSVAIASYARSLVASMLPALLPPSATRRRQTSSPSRATIPPSFTSTHSVRCRTTAIGPANSALPATVPAAVISMFPHSYLPD
ncbi:hypothetical protein MSAN_00280000 [Mycena sanguinolenta]|uniref:Uncharacterized protein n=1 Tax=Mycena sanguinolenta TaxID=230812 RepID=A0A8H7DN63_9AGAR|nr:hypothetical protein MSAN_00280000 [Mycena sanguinolenta]